jgi:hypothetical protein
MAAVPTEFEIIDAHHVVIYCRPTSLEDDDRPGPSAFSIRNSDTDGRSCDWWEYFLCSDIQKALSDLRSAISADLDIAKTSKLCGLNVGHSVTAVRSAREIELTCVCNGVPRPSHSLIKGYDASLSPEVRDAIAHVLTECVAFLYPGRPSI